MSVWKLLLPAAGLLLIVCGALALSHGDRSGETGPLPVSRGNAVQERYARYVERVEAAYDSLLRALEADAPDLVPLMESPDSPRYGYGILPRIIGDTALSDRGRPRPAWYSWPWTDRLIDSGFMEVGRFQADLRSAGKAGSAEKRALYAKLARAYREIRANRQKIHAHIQHNRLWQGAVARHRDRYDRETELYHAAVERQAILRMLRVPSEWRLPDSPAVIRRIGAGGVLLERERRLSRAISEATEPRGAPPFVSLEHRAPKLWIVHVPFYTDIDDTDYVRFIKESIEAVWRLRDGGEEFRVEMDISFIPVARLYERDAPETGDKIDPLRHVAAFPPDRAVLTTGAGVTHVYNRAIVLGPHDLTPRVLAHEFGHILGFRDLYFRGYRDLGRDGYEIMEMVGEPGDIMGSPGGGAVLRRHFEIILGLAGEAQPAAGQEAF